MFLQKIDIFVQKQVDERTRTSIGGILTLCLPGAVIAYLVISVTSALQKPPVQTTNTIAATDEVFQIKLNCTSIDGCFVTDSYDFNENKACVNKLSTLGYNQHLSKCKRYKYNDLIELNFCRSSNPQDGPKILWARSQSCSKSYIDQDSFQSCTSGVAVLLETIYLDQSNTFSSQSQAYIDLHYGTHSFQFQKSRFSSSSFGSSDQEIWTSVPSHLNSESVIDQNNACCWSSSISATCNTNARQGTANDNYEIYKSNGNQTLVLVPGLYFQVRIEAAPTYELKSYEQSITVTISVLSTAGSFYTIIVSFCSVLVLIWRLITENPVSTSRQEIEDKSGKKGPKVLKSINVDEV